MTYLDLQKTVWADVMYRHHLCLLVSELHGDRETCVALCQETETEHQETLGGDVGQAQHHGPLCWWLWGGGMVEMAVIYMKPNCWVLFGVAYCRSFPLLWFATQSQHLVFPKKWEEEKGTGTVWWRGTHGSQHHNELHNLVTLKDGFHLFIIYRIGGKY